MHDRSRELTTAAQQQPEYELTAEDVWNTYGSPEDVGMLEWLLQDIEAIDILLAPWRCGECGRDTLIFHALALDDDDVQSATGAMYWPGIVQEIRAAAARSMQIPMGVVKPRENEVCQGCAWCDAPINGMELHEDAGVLGTEGVFHDQKFIKSGQRFRLKSWPPAGIEDVMERANALDYDDDDEE